MSSHSRFKQLTSALLIIATSAVFSQPGLAAKTCKDWALVGQATAASQGQAKAQARTDWAQKVQNQFGFQWANWTIAEDKWEQCERAGRGFRCLAHGRPCTPGLGIKLQ